MSLDINRILKNDPRPCRYGAPMGDSDLVDGPLDRLMLQRVRFVDGDYGPDGTYWGGGRGTEPLWCAFNGGDDPGMRVRLYVRAKDRRRAIELLQADYPGIAFLRGS